MLPLLFPSPALLCTLVRSPWEGILISLNISDWETEGIVLSIQGILVAMTGTTLVRRGSRGQCGWERRQDLAILGFSVTSTLPYSHFPGHSGACILVYLLLGSSCHQK